MGASQSGVFNLQEFTDIGGPLVGGRLYTFVSGTTTFKAAYTDAAGIVPQTYTADGQGGQYIALNARGELPASLYLLPGAYDFTLKRADGSTVWTREADPIAIGLDAGAVTYTAPGSALTRSIAAILAQGIWVDDYPNCDPTGATDSFPAAAAALARAVALVTNRFLAGAQVGFRRGTYLLSATLATSTSNIVFAGESSESTVVYAPNATYDIFSFDGSALALYNVGVRNMRIYTPGNATAGAHIRAVRCINSSSEDIHYVGHYDALVLDGCAKWSDTNGLRSQENRTPGTAGRYCLALLGTNYSCSDITVMGANFIYAPGQTDTLITLRIEAADGLYVGPGHQFGKLSFAPAVTSAFPTGQTIASVKFEGWYFDASMVENIEMIGNSQQYRNIDFEGCNCRTSGGNGTTANGVGLKVNAATAINRVSWVGGDFDGHPLWAIQQISPIVDFVVAGGTRFNNNNTSNSSTGGDVIASGQVTISDTRHEFGGALGTAISLTGTATNCNVHDCDLVNSTAGNKIVNANPAGSNRIHDNPGFVTKGAPVSITVGVGAMSVSFPHGLSVTPAVTDINLRLGSSAFGSAGARITAAGAVNATLTLDTGPTGSPATYIAYPDTEHP